MRLKPIRSNRDYEAALARIDKLMDTDPEPGTSEGDELQVLALLVEQYEDEHGPIGVPTPVGAIRFRMDQQGLSQQDLVPYIGSPSKVSEVLSGKRALSLSMIRRLHEGLGIPLEVLIQERDERGPSRSASCAPRKTAVATEAVHAGQQAVS